MASNRWIRAVQIANPSFESLALHTGLEIGKLSSVAVVSPAQLHVHAVAASPKTPTETAAARAEIIAPLSKAFVDSTFTSSQQFWIYVQNTFLLYRYDGRSWISVALPKRRSPSPLVPNL